MVTATVCGTTQLDGNTQRIRSLAGSFVETQQFQADERGTRDEK